MWLSQFSLCRLLIALPQCMLSPDTLSREMTKAVDMVLGVQPAEEDRPLPPNR